jgi:hypothetical protein
MGALLVIAMATGVVALAFASCAVFVFGIQALRHFMAQASPLAGRYLVLEAVAIASLGLCVLLLCSQPVEWPWSPWHIPLYILVTWLCKSLFSRSGRLEQTKVERERAATHKNQEGNS